MGGTWKMKIEHLYNQAFIMIVFLQHYVVVSCSSQKKNLFFLLKGMIWIFILVFFQSKMYIFNFTHFLE
jgi:hypothetical protein